MTDLRQTLLSYREDEYRSFMSSLLPNVEPDTIIGVLSRMKAVISMRLHALIFASGLGIPLVGIVYDPKVSGFLDYLSQTRYMDLSSLEQQILIDMVEDALLEKRDSYSVDRLRDLAAQNETAAAELLK